MIAAILTLAAWTAADDPPRGFEAVREYVERLARPDGGFGHRPGWPSDAVCTLQAVEALDDPARAVRRQPDQKPLPEGLMPFTIQIQAPGQGSPREAAELARALKIHLWGAKNAPPGWIEQAQAEARSRGIPVTFFQAFEEFSRIILDDSIERGGYSALSTFHMRQNFAEFLPWIHRYRGILPLVTLQDARGIERW